MGFRDPITSPEVDTRPADTAAGVRMYEAPDPDTGLPRGVVEWTTGHAGDVPAQAVQTADPSPRSITTPYGRLAVKGGTYGTVTGPVTAPELDLSVEQDAATGNPVRVARVIGADVVDLGPQSVRQAAILTSGAGWALWNDATYKDLAFWLHQDGWATVSGLIKYVGGTGAGARMVPLSGNWVPRSYSSPEGSRHILGGAVNDVPALFDIRPDGLYLRGALPTVGVFVAVNGRYPTVLATA